MQGPAAVCLARLAPLLDPVCQKPVTCALPGASLASHWPSLLITPAQYSLQFSYPQQHRSVVFLLAVLSVLQLMVTIGILVSQLINYGTQHLEWGWRLSLGIAFVPAFILFLGTLATSFLATRKKGGRGCFPFAEVCLTAWLRLRHRHLRYTKKWRSCAKAMAAMAPFSNPCTIPSAASAVCNAAQLKPSPIACCRRHPAAGDAQLADRARPPGGGAQRPQAHPRHRGDRHRVRGMPLLHLFELDENRAPCCCLRSAEEVESRTRCTSAAATLTVCGACITFSGIAATRRHIQGAAADC